MAIDQKFARFMHESGFKVLALAKLSECEYSIILYLFNCAVSGLDQIITTQSELASLTGYDDDIVNRSMGSLAAMNIVRVHYGDSAGVDPTNVSMRVYIQYQVSKWVISNEVEQSSHDAVVFPFRRQGQSNLQVLDGEKKDPKLRRAGEEHSTWKRVYESFANGRELSNEDQDQAMDAARVLVDTHPVDQVLLMIRHFDQRIPTLSLLASSWQHYQEQFEEETQKVDLLGARQKHHELDQKIREQARTLLDDVEKKELGEEEKTVLQILLKHRHPRRQLFWAYQLRSRYPGLSSFFSDNMGLMLSVTTGGIVVKKHD
jgi:hypothetical protein